MRRKKGEWFTFTVEGIGEFPYDMLRYDACWPQSEGHDSAKLAVHYNEEKRRVVLITCWEGAPTAGRWASFNWRLVGHGELRDPKEFP